jgi:N-acetylglucosamine-6-phosphate deacetylase
MTLLYNNDMVTLLAGARVMHRAGVVEDGWLELAGGRIVAAGAGPPPRAPDRDLAGRWVLPGFVDVHVHGGGGASFDSGDLDEARLASRFHRRHGTTTTLASLMTAGLDELERSLASLAGLVESGELAGLHLEGPFLNPARCGAHDPRLLRAPARDDVARLLAAGRGSVRMVTLAPELDGGLEAVRAVVGHGAIAAVGHTDAGYELTRDAIEAGATVATHLFNAMRPLHHRDPGPVPALLEDHRVTLELICDGVHLDPGLVHAVFALAGPDRVALVTDAIAAAGAGEGGGAYELGGRSVRVEGGVARLAGTDTLAGSTLTMDAALRVAVRAGVPVADAARALSETPARLLGLQEKVGALEPGMDADLVVLDDELRVQAVMAKGAWVT